jgi:predicted naringenin-chalcone synthase
MSESGDEHAVCLGQRAAEACLANARMTPQDIDLIITTSCTGFMIPSLDAHLINLMGFRPDVRRMPLTELGCGAGAMALARASEFVRAFPEKTVLVLSVELATLTFQRGDLSQGNLISCGQRLLSYLEEQLGLCRSDTQFSWDVLSQYGNLSSATILFILHEWLTKRTMTRGDYGLAAAFGPGFSAEVLLLQWA